MNNLIVLINTQNEAENIIECLESVKWIPNIIVIDMGSIDNTVTLVKRYTSKIYNFPDIGYVTDARNFGLNQIKQGWVLVIDADEKLSLNSKEVIKNLISSTSNNNIEGFFFPRRNYVNFYKYLKYGYFYPDYQLRLFKVRRNIRYKEFIHELPSIDRNKIEFINNIELFHSSVKTKYKSLFSYFRLVKYIKIEGIVLSKTEIKSLRLFCDITINPLRHFYRCYIKKKGFMDGYSGLIAAINYGLYQGSISFYALYIRIIYINFSFKLKDENLNKILYENSINS
jgi:glycosyltransferase involved in cell wall biosynthesis